MTLFGAVRVGGGGGRGAALGAAATAAGTGGGFPERASVEARTLDEHLHHHRGRIVRAALEETGWNVREAATRLDVARSYLYKLIALHGLTRPAD